VVASIILTDNDQKRLRQKLAEIPQRKVLLSSCGLNPAIQEGLS